MLTFDRSIDDGLFFAICARLIEMMPTGHRSPCGSPSSAVCCWGVPQAWMKARWKPGGYGDIPHFSRSTLPYSLNSSARMRARMHQVPGSRLLIQHLAPGYRIEMAMPLNHGYPAVIKAVLIQRDPAMVVGRLGGWFAQEKAISR